MELLTVALASFTTVIFTLGILPFRIARKLMPVAATAVGYAMVGVYDSHPRLVMGAAAAGLVAVITRFAVVEAPEPWSLDDLIGGLINALPQPRSRRTPARSSLPRGVGRRIPDL